MAIIDAIKKISRNNAIELLMFRNVEVQFSKKVKDAFHSMWTYKDSNLICIGKIPKQGYDKIEMYIEDMLEHEILHIVMDNIGEEKASSQFDNLFPMDRDFRKWMNG